MVKTDLTTTGKFIFVLFSHAKYEKPLLIKPHCDNKIKIRENTMNTCSCSQVSLPKFLAFQHLTGLPSVKKKSLK